MASNGIVPPAAPAPGAPNVHSQTPISASKDHPVGNESKFSDTVVAPSPGPQTNTGAVTSKTSTTAVQLVVLPEGSVTYTVTSDSPKLEHSKVQFAGSSVPHIQNKL